MTDLITLIPVYNDWECLVVLLKRLDATAQQLNLNIEVVLVDDGSTTPAPTSFEGLSCLTKIGCLRLRRNLGHQRAIAIGLSFIQVNCEARAVVVMDADGEDRPEDIERLYRRCQELDFTHAVFAKRTRRAESLLFRMGYHSYKAIHLLLTGVKVDVGNFSVLPWASLEHVVVVSELWNHYAAGAALSKLRIDKIGCPRGKRIMGTSKMNVSSLVLHGFRAISLYEQVGIRTMGGSLLLSALVMLSLWCHGDQTLLLLAIPIINILFVVCLIFLFQSLRLRSTAEFIPVRDFELFVTKYSQLS